MSSFKENTMTKEMREVGDWQTKTLTYTYARQEEGMGVTVLEASLSVQRIYFFLFSPTFRPRFAFFSVLFLHITLGYLPPLPNIGPTCNLTPHENVFFTLRGGLVLTCCFFWGRVLDDTNFSSSPLTFYLFPLRFASCLGTVSRSWKWRREVEKKKK